MRDGTVCATIRTDDMTKRVINLALGLVAADELIACICDCGHLDSEHYVTGKRLVAANCGACKCPKFQRAFFLESKAPVKKKPKTKKRR